jgi:hypothetical protein
MSDIEQKVFYLILEASYAKRGVLFDQCKLRDIPDIAHDALAYSIEQHEATQQEYSDFRQLVSDVVYAYANATGGGVDEWENLKSFIIPKPKADPLVGIFAEIFAGSDIANSGGYWDIERKFRAAMEARELEIREISK